MGLDEGPNGFLDGAGLGVAPGPILDLLERIVFALRCLTAGLDPDRSITSNDPEGQREEHHDEHDLFHLHALPLRFYRLRCLLVVLLLPHDVLDLQLDEAEQVVDTDRTVLLSTSSLFIPFSMK